MTNPEELSEFIGDATQLVNALNHIAETQSNGKTNRLVAKAAADLIASLTPKPIEEAPRDEEFILGIFEENKSVCVCYGLITEKGFEQFSLANTDDDEFTHYIPLSALTALMKG